MHQPKCTFLEWRQKIIFVYNRIHRDISLFVRKTILRSIRCLSLFDCVDNHVISRLSRHKFDIARVTAVIVPSHWRNGISKHEQLDYLFTGLLWLSSKLHISSPRRYLLMQKAFPCHEVVMSSDYYGKHYSEIIMGAMTFKITSD